MDPEEGEVEYLGQSPGYANAAPQLPPIGPEGLDENYGPAMYRFPQQGSAPVAPDGGAPPMPPAMLPRQPEARPAPIPGIPAPPPGPAFVPTTPNDPAIKMHVADAERALDMIRQRNDLSPVQKRYAFENLERKLRQWDPQGLYRRGGLDSKVTPIDKFAAQNVKFFADHGVALALDGKGNPHWHTLPKPDNKAVYDPRAMSAQQWVEHNSFTDPSGGQFYLQPDGKLQPLGAKGASHSDEFAKNYDQAHKHLMTTRVEPTPPKLEEIEQEMTNRMLISESHRAGVAVPGDDKTDYGKQIKTAAMSAARARDVEGLRALSFLERMKKIGHERLTPQERQRVEQAFGRARRYFQDERLSAPAAAPAEALKPVPVPPLKQATNLTTQHIKQYPNFNPTGVPRDFEQTWKSPFE